MHTREIEMPFDLTLLPTTTLTCGNITCLYEAGNLRYIRYDGREIIRMIYGAVRDVNWATLPPVLSQEKIEKNEDSFSIQYTAVYNAGDISYQAHYSIKGSSDSTIIFSMKGESLSDFKMNRIGLCILHPIKEYAGKKIRITQPNGDTYQSAFPWRISAHQPFLNIQKLEVALDDSTAVEVSFKGDIFETEDQRNWTDNSYKTYSTPLAIPLPAYVKAGDKIEQQIKLQLNITGKQPIKKLPADFLEEKIPFPAIGYCKAGDQPVISSARLSLLRQIPFDHYRVELPLFEPWWKEFLRKSVAEAKLLQTKVELVVYFQDDYEPGLNDLAFELEPCKEVISSLLLLCKGQNISPEMLMLQGYAFLKERFPGIETGYGTDGHFAELNRHPPLDVPCDFVSFGLSPLAHANDSRTLIENLVCQQDLLKTLRATIGNKKVHVSPVNLKMRQYDSTKPGKGFIAVADERQHTFAMASWTLICIQNLCEAGHITLYELVGNAGILSEMPLSPLYDVLKTIKEFDPKWIIKTYQNGDLLMDKCIMENTTGNRLIFNCDLPF